MHAPVVSLPSLRRMERFGEVAAAGHDARVVVDGPSQLVLVPEHVVTTPQ